MTNNNLKIKNYTDAPEVEIQEGLDVVAVNATGTLNRIPIENFSQGGSGNSKPIYLVGTNDSGGGGVSPKSTVSTKAAPAPVTGNTLLENLADTFGLTVSEDDAEGDIFIIPIDASDRNSHVTINNQDWCSHGLDVETVTFIYQEFLKGRPFYFTSQAEPYYIIPINEIDQGNLCGYGKDSDKSAVLFGPYNGGGATENLS